MIDYKYLGNADYYKVLVLFYYLKEFDKYLTKAFYIFECMHILHSTLCLQTYVHRPTRLF